MDMARRSLVKSCATVLFVVFLSLQLHAERKVSDLPQRFRDWLQHDVVYIINNDEKKVFLSLETDAERERFIEHFWEIRNPDPGAPSNAFKEEHYRRIEYANAHFGKEDGTEGWRTDRGRVYITLGPPNQTNRLLAVSNLWPMEIWFYSNDHPALPPHFYIVFYKKEGFGDYKIYSPYMDGPDKLVSQLSENNRVKAYREIRNLAGAEVARNSLTLLTDEPIDAQTASSSLQSDVMLATIRDLPNNPISKEMLRQRGKNLEMVRSRVIYGEEFLKVFAVPLRNSEGSLNLHYLLSLKSPQDFAVGKQGDRYYYNVSTEVAVKDMDGKVIFTHVAPVSRYMTASEFEEVKGKLFGVEGWVPIAPGKYKLSFLLTNKVNNSGFRAEKDIAVPQLPSVGYYVTDVVAFRDAQATGPGGQYLPFAFGGIKFTPMAPEETDLLSGEDLNVLYQIWSVPGSKPGNLTATYTYGKLSGRSAVKTVQEEFSGAQFDQAGSMINGKKLPTVGLQPGNFRLSITVADPASNQKSSSGSSFRIIESEQRLRFWRLSDETMGDEVARGSVDLDRGLLYHAIHANDQALTFYKLALQRNPQNHQARARLADLLFSMKKYADVIAVFSRNPISREDGEGAVVQYAQSLAESGDMPRAIATLEGALQWGANSKPIYLSLADCYKRSGNTAKAEELMRKSEAALAR